MFCVKLAVHIICGLELVLGLILFIIGLLLKYSNFIKGVLDIVTKQWKIEDPKVKEYYDAVVAFIIENVVVVSAAVVTIGVILIFLAVAGMLVVCFNFQILVIVYDVFLAIVVAAFAIATITLYAKRDEAIRVTFVAMIKIMERYGETTADGVIVTKFINFLMTVFNCCGFDNVNEFPATATALPLVCCANASSCTIALAVTSAVQTCRAPITLFVTKNILYVVYYLLAITGVWAINLGLGLALLFT